MPIVIQRRTLGTFVGEIIQAGLQIAALVETPFNAAAVKEAHADPARWYSAARASVMPTTFIIKARKSFLVEPCRPTSAWSHRRVSQDLACSRRLPALSELDGRRALCGSPRFSCVAAGVGETTAAAQSGTERLWFAGRYDRTHLIVYFEAVHFNDTFPKGARSNRAAGS